MLFRSPLLAGTVGIALVAGAAAVINCLVEQKIDAVMARTRARPLPMGQLTSAQALGFSVVIGGIEASLRRIAHYDYWSDKVRRSILVDSKADLLVYGNAERAIVEIAHRLAQRKPIESITDVRGTAFLRKPEIGRAHV